MGKATYVDTFMDAARRSNADALFAQHAKLIQSMRTESQTQRFEHGDHGLRGAAS
jgi:hypothetical protein